MAGGSLLSPRLAVLALPGPNRVYARSTPALAVAELRFLDTLAGSGLGAVAVETIGGLPYVTCDGDWAEPLVRDVVGTASFRYAVFSWDGTALIPRDLPSAVHWDDDLVTIQRYAGKTNEQFTKLLLNLAVAAGHGQQACRPGAFASSTPCAGGARRSTTPSWPGTTPSVSTPTHLTSTPM